MADFPVTQTPDTVTIPDPRLVPDATGQTGVKVLTTVDGATPAWAAPTGGVDTDDQTAAEVPFTPAGDLQATDVQSALTELDNEKANATAVAIALDAKADQAAVDADNDAQDATISEVSSRALGPIRLMAVPPDPAVGVDGMFGFYFADPGVNGELWAKASGVWAKERDLPF